MYGARDILKQLVSTDLVLLTLSFIACELSQHLSTAPRWMRNTATDLANVRLPPDGSEEVALQPGSEVEVFLPHQEGEPSGWWFGKVTKVKGELVVVEFADETHTYSDIVDISNLRSANPKLVSKATFQCG